MFKRLTNIFAYCPNVNVNATSASKAFCIAWYIISGNVGFDNGVEREFDDRYSGIRPEEPD